MLIVRTITLMMLNILLPSIIFTPFNKTLEKNVNKNSLIIRDHYSTFFIFMLLVNIITLTYAFSVCCVHLYLNTKELGTLSQQFYLKLNKCLFCLKLMAKHVKI